MSTKEEHKSASPQPAAINGVDAALDAEALHDLAGFFDVLIQMDFAQKKRDKERIRSEDTDLRRSTKANRHTDEEAV
jgi:hypothetical protein